MSMLDTAFPFVNRLVTSEEDNDNQYGLSKLEFLMAVLMPTVILKHPEMTTDELTDEAMHFAIAILNKANR